MADLEIKNLHAQIGDVKILKGVNLEINKGEVHALMGPNGSGKSTLSSVIMGHPDYEVTEGDILFMGESILEMDPEERAKAGVFLCFQYPVAVPGVSISSFLKKAVDARHPEGKAPSGPFLKEMRENMAFLEMDASFANRGLNEGFSGGEKKRMEILQMMMFKPGMVIMDETDSGLDIDALRIVSKGVNKMKNDDMGLLVITHYERILTYIKPDHLHILMEGRVVMSGGPDLVKELEEKGYDWVREQAAATA
ncbi:MAG: Fe-S cluster assembly ATPase SufC [Verrucomicrobia bacterium]|jgi:Fe-S cluster assembly ATP-binding protein|nr:Fe-S cluster assembly ATPase SufC [Verrucomicrobiota bacterium]MCH8525639.1 Fe-S cluster assembly ATPase SufC [Kiritimatiellia bacterium]